eukprot:SAG31_NODE_753_length_12340_cov_8.786619_7_plen_98_part_00
MQEFVLPPLLILLLTWVKNSYAPYEVVVTGWGGDPQCTPYSVADRGAVPSNCSATTPIECVAGLEIPFNIPVGAAPRGGEGEGLRCPGLKFQTPNSL